MSREGWARLVAGVRSGDAGALGALVDGPGARIYRVARALTGGMAEADAIVREVLVGLFREIERGEGAIALDSWLYRATIAAALRERRRGRGRPEAERTPALPPDDVPALDPDGARHGSAGLPVDDWSWIPDEELLTPDTRAVLQDAFEALPDWERIVLLLRDVEGLSTADTALVVGESLVSVRIRLHRARMALRERLTRFLGRPGPDAPGPP